MKTKIIFAFLMFWLGNAHAELSTLRVTCEDQAAGAEVSINGKFKGECPIDIKVGEGKLHLKAVKKIAGKDNVFEQKIKIGDGVTKRIEVLFGAAESPTSTSIQVNHNSVAQQRYLAEMDEYNRSIQACLPKHAVELRRLKQAVSDAYKEQWAECRQRAIDQGNPGDVINGLCGKPSLDESNYWHVRDTTDEGKALQDFNKNANSWCAEQFTKPIAP